MNQMDLFSQQGDPTRTTSQSQQQGQFIATHDTLPGRVQKETRKFIWKFYYGPKFFTVQSHGFVTFESLMACSMPQLHAITFYIDFFQVFSDNCLSKIDAFPFQYGFFKSTMRILEMSKIWTAVLGKLDAIQKEPITCPDGPSWHQSAAASIASHQWGYVDDKPNEFILSKPLVQTIDGILDQVCSLEINCNFARSEDENLLASVTKKAKKVGRPPTKRTSTQPRRSIESPILLQPAPLPISKPHHQPSHSSYLSHGCRPPYSSSSVIFAASHTPPNTLSPTALFSPPTISPPFLDQSPLAFSFNPAAVPYPAIMPYIFTPLDTMPYPVPSAADSPLASPYASSPQPPSFLYRRNSLDAFYSATSQAQLQHAVYGDCAAATHQKPLETFPSIPISSPMAYQPQMHSVCPPAPSSTSAQQIHDNLLHDACDPDIAFTLKASMIETTDLSASLDDMLFLTAEMYESLAKSDIQTLFTTADRKDQHDSSSHPLSLSLASSLEAEQRQHDDSLSYWDAASELTCFGESSSLDSLTKRHQHFGGKPEFSIFTAIQ
jgi:hypothetical protein